MGKVILYSTGCPRCNVLKKKLDACNIAYEENTSIDEMVSIGIKQAPVLSVDGELLDFKKAVDWANMKRVEE